MSSFTVPGDMALNAGETDCVIVSGLVAVLQQIRTGLQVFAKTWHYDRNAGLPYVDQIFVNNPDLRAIRIIFWNFLLSVIGVTTVDDLILKIDPVTRTLYVKFTVRTAFGDSVSDTVSLLFPVDV